MSIPHVFSDGALLQEALTHASAASEGTDNQRLEFLGDAVLQLAVSEWLIQERPSWTEGQLSKARARLVNADALARLADGWDIPNLLRVGRGERASGVAQNTNVRADAFEAVIAALYLDAGFAAVRHVLVPLFETQLEQVVTLIDARSMLLQWSQKQKLAQPSYVTVASQGQAHAQIFSVEVIVGGRRFGPGKGPSKRVASADAARMALDGLGVVISDD